MSGSTFSMSYVITFSRCNPGPIVPFLTRPSHAPRDLLLSSSSTHLILMTGFMFTLCMYVGAINQRWFMVIALVLIRSRVAYESPSKDGRRSVGACARGEFRRERKLAVVRFSFYIHNPLHFIFNMTALYPTCIPQCSRHCYHS